MSDECRCSVASDRTKAIEQTCERLRFVSILQQRLSFRGGPQRFILENFGGLPGTIPRTGKDLVGNRKRLLEPSREPAKCGPPLVREWTAGIIGPSVGIAVEGLGVSNDQQSHGSQRTDGRPC